ncbi:MAG: hypothetical protein COA79_18050 [Planctomycetota bacterium]|nr:MAG: hypothetical protein COA79_18050 [Planctomycetota bacterium]
MLLLKLLKKEAPKNWRKILFMAIASGIANGALLAIINNGSSAASNDESKGLLLVLFTIAMGIFIVAKKWSLTQSTKLIENILRDLRIRFADKIRKSELQIVENLGKGEVFTKVSQETNQISQSSILIANACQESIMLCFCLLYIAFLSFAAFFVTIGSMAIAIYIYFIHQKGLEEDMNELTNQEGQLLDSLSHLIDGFKEVRINSNKSDDVFKTFTQKTLATEDSKININVKIATDIMFSHVFFYFLIAVIVFLLPQFVPTYNDVVLKLTAALLFIVGPLEMIVACIPVMTRSNLALNNLFKLEKILDKNLPIEDEPNPATLEKYFDFKEIDFKEVSFSYRDNLGESLFSVGPFDFNIKRGDTIFIIGGNGSGKSTVLKVLLGLYNRDNGSLSIDNQIINNHSLTPFRNLFSTIFTDFHLFDKIYGIKDVDEEKINRLIDEMDLTGKTSFKDGRFTNTHLSTGQKKRLALIIALMEDKPVYIFDEWAADQDPHFRKHFYETILKQLKSDGKTILAVTHDDHYFHHADRIIKLDYGTVQEIKDRNDFKV